MERTVLKESNKCNLEAASLSLSLSLSLSPRGQNVYVNRLSTPPVLLTSVLYSSIMIHTIVTLKESDPRRLKFQDSTNRKCDKIM